MIRKRISHIFNNYKEKPSIYDYVKEPSFGIKDYNCRGVSYVARPTFNTIESDTDEKKVNSSQDYKRYKMKHGNKRIHKDENT